MIANWWEETKNMNLFFPCQNVKSWLVKFMYSEKATKILLGDISTFFWLVLVPVKKKVDILQNFCCLLRIYEVYTNQDILQKYEWTNWNTYVIFWWFKLPSQQNFSQNESCDIKDYKL